MANEQREEFLESIIEAYQSIVSKQSKMFGKLAEDVVKFRKSQPDPTYRAKLISKIKNLELDNACLKEKSDYREAMLEISEGRILDLELELVEGRE